MKNKFDHKVLKFFKEKNVDCDKYGIVYTRFGNTINLLELIKDFILSSSVGVFHPYDVEVPTELNEYYGK